MIKKLHRIFFSLLVLLLPVNLGIHFLSVDSFVRSRFVDYLVPTVWLQDVLIFLILFFWFCAGDFKKVYGKSASRLILLFLFSLLPSFLIAERLHSSFAFLSHLVLYSLLCVYVMNFIRSRENFEKILKLLSIGLFVLFFFAVGQWVKQGSIFNNYFVLGEQPYDSSTFGIARTDFFNALKIPSYGTFRHPNVFGGFLAVVLFWISSYIYLFKKNLYLKVIFLLGFIALFLTFSLTSMVSLFLAILFLKLIKKYGKRGVIFSLLITFSIFSLSLFLPILTSRTSLGTDPSFYRRANLLRSSFNMLENNILFGIGLNNFTVELPKYLPRTQILTFNQPVHNIFVLILTESGIFPFVLFVSLIMFSIKTTLQQSFGLAAIFFISILQLVILGSFDHFLYTIHQTSILYWLTLGLALAYTKEDVEV